MTPATQHRIWELAVLVSAHRIAQSWAQRDGRTLNQQMHAARAAALSLEAFAVVADSRRRLAA